jgi:hypothetical protein
MSILYHVWWPSVAWSQICLCFCQFHCHCQTRHVWQWQIRKELAREQKQTGTQATPSLYDLAPLPNRFGSPFIPFVAHNASKFQGYSSRARDPIQDLPLIYGLPPLPLCSGSGAPPIGNKNFHSRQDGGLLPIEERKDCVRVTVEYNFNGVPFQFSRKI